MLNENIFKFAMVRAPEHKTEKELGFSTFGSSGQTTTFMETLTGLRSQENGNFLAKQEAQSFISSSGIKSLDSDSDLSEVNAVFTWMEAGTFSGEEISALESELAIALGSSTASFLVSTEYTVSKEKIWNSYIASIIDDTSHYIYRQTGLNGIQALKLIQLTANPPSGLSAQDIISLSKECTPIIYSGILRGTVPFISDPVGAVTFQPLTQSQQDAISKFENLETAIEELVAAQEEQLFQLHQLDQIENQEISVILEDPELRPSFPTNDESTNLTPNLSIGDGGVEEPIPYKLNQSSINELSASTQTLLSEHNIDLLKKTTIETISIFEEKMDIVIFSAFRSKAVEFIHLNNGNINTVSFPEVFDLQMLVPKDLEVIAQAAAKENYAFTYQTPQVPQSELAPGVRILGIADLKLVQQTLQKYELGEISHIQNVMKTEKRDRTHRRFQQSEQEVILTSELSEENERSLTTSERFQLQREAESTLREDSRLEVGASVSAQFGPVKSTANVGYATSNSRSEAQRNAATYARDVTERSVEKITKKTTESRRVRSLQELEDTNFHSFDNQQGTEHVTGIYRWVNKIYEAQVYNYGKRLMLEFVIPEPSALYLHSLKKSSLEGQIIEKPVSMGNLTPSDIKPQNYSTWVHRYGAENIQAPPSKYKMIGISTSKSFDGKTDPTADHELTLEITNGYVARYVNITFKSSANDPPAGASLIAAIGSSLLGILYDNTGHNIVYKRLRAALSPAEEKLALSVHSTRLASYIMNIEVLCERKKEHLEVWQLDTYTKIRQAYEQKKSEYEERLLASRLESLGVEVPDFGEPKNLEIVKNELKRICVSIMTNRVSDSFSSHTGRDSENYPRLDFLKAEVEGKIIQHFEEACEWTQMTYNLYPYFWGYKQGWMEKLNLSHPDSKFQSFLQSGAARIILPIHPSYNDSILHYLQNGTIWQGGKAPVIEDELFIAVAEELKQKVDPNGEPEGEPWGVTIPTKLVMLEGATDSTLPDWTQS